MTLTSYRNIWVSQQRMPFIITWHSTANQWLHDLQHELSVTTRPLVPRNKRLLNRQQNADRANIITTIITTTTIIIIHTPSSSIIFCIFRATNKKSSSTSHNLLFLLLASYFLYSWCLPICGLTTLFWVVPYVSFLDI
jgi:hypothetical protein